MRWWTTGPRRRWVIVAPVLLLTALIAASLALTPGAGAQQDPNQAPVWQDPDCTVGGRAIYAVNHDLGRNRPGHFNVRVWISATDPEGGAIEYVRPDGPTQPHFFSHRVFHATIDKIAYSFINKRPYLDDQTYAYQIIARDTAGLEAPATVYVNMNGYYLNGPGALTDAPPPACAFLFEQERHEVTLYVDSPTSELLTVEITPQLDPPAATYAASTASPWPPQFSIDSATGVITYSRLDDTNIRKGEYTLVVEANRGDRTRTAEVVVTVPNRPPYVPRTYYSFILDPHSPSVPNILTIEVIDPDGDPINCSLLRSGGSYIEVDRHTCVVSFERPSYRPWPLQIADYRATVWVRESNERVKDGDYLDVDVMVHVRPVVNTPPTFDAETYRVSLDTTGGDVAELVILTISDPDVQPITFRAVGDWPSQLTLNSTTGVISYTADPNAEQFAGTYRLTVQVSDGKSTATTTVVVMTANIAPRYEDDPYSTTLDGDSGDVPTLFSIEVDDADNDPLTYSVVGDWPEQFSIDAVSGVISYTRGAIDIAAGEYSLELSADDGFGHSITITATVTVPNRRPRFQTAQYTVDLASDSRPCRRAADRGGRRSRRRDAQLHGVGRLALAVLN